VRRTACAEGVFLAMLLIAAGTAPRRRRGGANCVPPDNGTDPFCNAVRGQKDKHNVGPDSCRDEISFLSRCPAMTCRLIGQAWSNWDSKTIDPTAAYRKAVGSVPMALHGCLKGETPRCSLRGKAPAAGSNIYRNNRVERLRCAVAYRTIHQHGETMRFQGLGHGAESQTWPPN
jgi:hypothetical protein